MRTISISAALLTGLLLATVPGKAAQLKTSASVVKVSAKAGKPDADGKQVVTITFNIDKPWHIYANPVGNDMLKGAQTTVTFTSKVEGVKFDYPAGKVIKDKTTGDYKTYEGKVTVKATVRRAKGDTGPLKLTVKVQACDDKRCLVTSRVKLTAE